MTLTPTGLLRKALRGIGYDVVPRYDAALTFRSDFYQRHNARRLEHLASLRLPVAGKSVLEVGAGIGDHSHYYIDRGCRLTITDVRQEHLQVLRRRYPEQTILELDLEHPTAIAAGPFDVVHCYGVLYHVADPGMTLEYLAGNCREMLLLETCVSFGSDHGIHAVEEKAAFPIAAHSGRGCRPTRPWLFDSLRHLFAHVYVPTTQPAHPEFPLDWSAPEKHTAKYQRAVFIASRAPIDNDSLSPALETHQVRQA